MTELSSKETILSRQLHMIEECGISEVVITTGCFDSVLIDYCQSLDLSIHITFVNNPIYMDTNYIYSIYCAREYLDDDIVLIHGDMVFERAVFEQVIASKNSCMTVSSTLPLPKKDFKAVIKDGHIISIGIDFFSDAMAAQPLYMLKREDWKIWLNQIAVFCENNEVKCYAESAFNQVSDSCIIYPLDIRNMLCNEVDNPEDLVIVLNRIKEMENRTVYMCFSTDILHSGHIRIIRKAVQLGKVIIGVLSDEAVCSYKRYPLLPLAERKVMF